MKKVLVITLALVMLLAVTACGSGTASGSTGGGTGNSGADSGETYDLVFASYQAEGGAFNNLLEKEYARLVNEMSDGRINMTIYSGGSLLAMGEVYSGVVAGSADLGIDCANQYKGRFPVTAMFEYPGTGFINSESASRAYDEAMKTLQPAEYDDVHVLWFQCVGPGILLTTKEVKTMSDLKGLQIRTSNTFADGVTALGGTPVSMGMGDVYEALRLGTIQGFTAAGEALQGFNLAEVADYCVMNPLFNGTFQFVMNKEKYESMPEDLQKVMDDAAAQVWNDAVVYYFSEQTEQALAYGKESNPNFQFSAIADDEMEKWQQAVVGTMDAYVAELDAQGMDGTGIQKYLFELVEKYNKQCAS
ncbi:MAG: TRAP transporter substrate-binding protein DctP [Clostridiales Family XIII bacterium]|jgi:TRAP-type C4-dicarboxylate transport system substrate-binding protein|nr:TRAP transporter substrate-binding protein DctP [Clostridiales Family XIII bacterium]